MSGNKNVSLCYCNGAFTLFIVFLVLKLTGVINWSYWYVTMPLWLSFVIIGLISFIIFGLFIIIQAISYIFSIKK
jgi:hypothetical protein